MTDLIFPIIIILTMFILIDAFDTTLPLLIMGLLFIPISWLFTYQIYGNDFTTMFDTSISLYIADVPGLSLMLASIMFIVPLSCFLKIMYLKIDTSKKTEEAMI